MYLNCVWDYFRIKKMEIRFSRSFVAKPPCQDLMKVTNLKSKCFDRGSGGDEEDGIMLILHMLHQQNFYEIIQK